MQPFKRSEYGFKITNIKLFFAVFQSLYADWDSGSSVMVRYFCGTFSTTADSVVVNRAARLLGRRNFPEVTRSP